MYLNNIYLLHGCVGDMKIRPLPQEKNHISHEQRQSFGLLNNLNNAEDKVNSKFKMRTMCCRSDAENNIPSALAVFSILILAMSSVFHFYQTITKEKYQKHQKMSIKLLSCYGTSIDINVE